MNCIEISHLTKRYHGFCLNDINLVVPTGSIMGFIGENGAGKTTTLKLILNLIKKDSGEIKIFELDHKKDEKEIKEQIGIVFDECFFHEQLNIKKVEKIVSKIYKNWKSDVFQAYVKRFQLPTDKSIKEFSRGMKMKLSIAAALSHQAKLLLLDEATSGLDPVVRNEILDVFLEFIQNEEHTILLSSHITSDLEKIADYITFIQNGEIVFSQDKEQILEDYGILKCGEAEFSHIDPKLIKGYRKNHFGYEVLIYHRKELEQKKSNVIIDPVKLEEIMMFYQKGEKE